MKNLGVSGLPSKIDYGSVQKCVHQKMLQGDGSPSHAMLTIVHGHPHVMEMIALVAVKVLPQELSADKNAQRMRDIQGCSPSVTGVSAVTLLWHVHCEVWWIALLCSCPGFVEVCVFGQAFQFVSCLFL